MRACSYCGKEYPDDAEVCAIDGTSLAPESPSLPPPPLEEKRKAWIEKSLLWLLGEFGEDNFLKRRTILPDASFFPDKYQATEDSVLKVVARVCSYMDLDPALVEVEFFTDQDELAALQPSPDDDEEEHSRALGRYLPAPAEQAKKKIALNVSQFKDPTRLVATIAHELGHVILLGGGKISREHRSHECLTDLITVFFGLGIFTANSAFQFSQWQEGRRGGWSVSRSGYMSEEMFAYALAAYTWMRGDTKPDWSKHLAMNVGLLFKQCQKYFQEGGQTSLRQLNPPKS